MLLSCLRPAQASGQQRGLKSPTPAAWLLDTHSGVAVAAREHPWHHARGREEQLLRYRDSQTALRQTHGCSLGNGEVQQLFQNSAAFKSLLQSKQRLKWFRAVDFQWLSFHDLKPERMLGKVRMPQTGLPPRVPVSVSQEQIFCPIPHCHGMNTSALRRFAQLRSNKVTGN